MQHNSESQNELKEIKAKVKVLKDEFKEVEADLKEVKERNQPTDLLLTYLNTKEAILVEHLKEKFRLESILQAGIYKFSYNDIRSRNSSFKTFIGWPSNESLHQSKQTSEKVFDTCRKRTVNTS
jgi:hypothetical protein